MSPPGYQAPVKKASRCRNERQEGLVEGKWIVREEGKKPDNVDQTNLVIKASISKKKLLRRKFKKIILGGFFPHVSASIEISGGKEITDE